MAGASLNCSMTMYNMGRSYRHPERSRGIPRRLPLSFRNRILRLRSGRGIAKLFVCFSESVNGELEILARMCRAHLRPHSRGAMRHYRIEEANNVNAFLQHAGRKLLRLCGIADHNWNDWMNSGLNRESTFR